MVHPANAQVLWTFSIYLEAVAILPQLILLQRTQNIDNLTGNYVALLGCVPRRLPVLLHESLQGLPKMVVDLPCNDGDVN